MQFVDFAFISASYFIDSKFTIALDHLELERVPSILGLPHKVESILSEAMIKAAQIHFFPPELAQDTIAHANSNLQEAQQSLIYDNKELELNITEDGNSSLCLKAEVSLPWM